MAKRGRPPLSPEVKLNRRQRREAARAKIAETLNAGGTLSPSVTLDQVILPHAGKTAIKTPEELAAVQAAHEISNPRSCHIFKENELVTNKRGPKPTIFDESEKEQFLIYLWNGFGKNWSCQKMGVSPQRMRRTIAIDEEFAAHVAAIDEALVERTDRVIFVDAMRRLSESRITSAYRFSSLRRGHKKLEFDRRLAVAELQMKREKQRAELGQKRSGDDRPPLECLSDEESDDYDFLCEKLQLAQEFTPEEALEYVRLERKLIAADRAKRGQENGTGKIT